VSAVTELTELSDTTNGQSAIPWQATALVVAMFAIAASVEWTMIRRLSLNSIRSVFDLTFVAFEIFWLIGWSVGVLALGGLSALLIFRRTIAPLAVSDRVVATLQRAAANRVFATRQRAVPVAQPELEAPSVMSPSGLALVAANLIPLAGVLFFGWSLANVMVLFWAESAVIGFYTILKLAVVGRAWSVFSILFFIGHFGGFMALHLGFIYALFVRGVNAAGAESVRAALVAVFAPVWLSLIGLVISHGISFYSNFIRGREYLSETTQRLMSGPYSRIVIMQLTIIFGGWVVQMLRSPVPALAILVLLKISADFSAHRSEHAN
jgi:hypothetical protein